MSSSEVVFAMYKPKVGMDAELERLIMKHVPTLKEYGLVTDRPTILARAQNGTFIEIFEWKSAADSKRAHEHPAIAKIWEAMGAVSTFEKLDSLEESKKPFPHFKVV